MQYKALAFAAALAMGVRAQEPLPEDVSASVMGVLLTALPPSALSVAASDPTAFQSEMYASLSAGNTPEWYQSLPSDVKTILPQLYPAPAEAGPTTSAESTTTETSTATETAGTISGKPTGASNGTTTVNSPTISQPGPTGAPSDTTNAAALPTAVLGSGLAGAIGVIGMLVL